MRGTSIVDGKRHWRIFAIEKLFWYMLLPNKLSITTDRKERQTASWNIKTKSPGISELAIEDFFVVLTVNKMFQMQIQLFQKFIFFVIQPWENLTMNAMFEITRFF